MLTWIDVMAGNIAGALWIVLVLYGRRMFLETPSVVTGAVFFVPLAFGFAILMWRLGYWAAEFSSARALARALQ